MNEVSISLPPPPRELSPNARVHWAKRAACVRRARLRAKRAALVAWRDYGFASFRPNVYVLVWVYKGRKPDADNVLASCKAYLDGIAEALGVDDRDLECGGVSRIHYKAYEDDADVGLLGLMVHFVLYEDGPLGGSISDTICEM